MGRIMISLCVLRGFSGGGKVAVSRWAIKTARTMAVINNVDTVHRSFFVLHLHMRLGSQMCFLSFSLDRHIPAASSYIQLIFLCMYTRVKAASDDLVSTTAKDQSGVSMYLVGS